MKDKVTITVNKTWYYWQLQLVIVGDYEYRALTGSEFLKKVTWKSSSGCSQYNKQYKT